MSGFTGRPGYAEDPTFSELPRPIEEPKPQEIYNSPNPQYETAYGIGNGQGGSQRHPKHQQDQQQNLDIDANPSSDGSSNAFPSKDLASFSVLTDITKLQALDKDLEMEMKRVDAHAQATRTEMDSIEQIISRNIDSSFSFMGEPPKLQEPPQDSPRIEPFVFDTNSSMSVEDNVNLQSSLSEDEAKLHFMQHERDRIADYTSEPYNHAAHLNPKEEPSNYDRAADERERSHWGLEGLVRDSIVEQNPLQAGTESGLQNTNIETTEPTDLESVSRRQSMSESSDISETSSIASVADSLFSIISGSSMSSVVGPTGAGERLVALLLHDIDLLVLYQETLERVTADRFERNFRRLLKLFAVELRQEAETSQQRSTARFVRYRARISAHLVRSSLCSSEKSQREEVARTLNDTYTIQDGESDESDGDSEPEDEEPGDLQQLERFIVTSQAFVKLREDLRSFIHLNSHAKNIEELKVEDGAYSKETPGGQNISDLERQTDEDMIAADNLIQSIKLGELEPHTDKDTASADFPISDIELELDQHQELTDDKTALAKDLLARKDEGFENEENLSSFTTRIRRFLEPRVPKCGVQLHDDYTEIQPGAARRLERLLNRRPGIGDIVTPGGGPGFITGLAGKILNSLMKIGRSFVKKEQGLPLQQLPPELGMQEPAAPPPRAVEALFLLICHNVGLYDKKLLQLSISDIESDRKLFMALKTHYQSKLGSWRSLLSFKALTGIKFFKFELYRKSQSVDVRLKNDIPGPDNQDYRYAPVPIDLIPPVGEDMLMHLFSSPDCAEDVPACLERFPKKLRERLACGGSPIAPGWGLQLEEGISRTKTTIAYLVLVFASSVWGVLWTVLGHDIQGAFTVSAYIVGIMLPLVTLLQHWA